MDIQAINRVIAALRGGTAWTLDDDDLALMTNEDPSEWPPPNPNYMERWLQQYIPRVGTEPGADWSQLADAIRARRIPVAKVVAVQPAPVAETDPELIRLNAEIERLTRESEEADERVRVLSFGASSTAGVLDQAHTRPPAPAPVSPVVAEPPMPPQPPRAEQAVTTTGRRWNAVVNDLISLGVRGPPTRATFERWVTRNGLDKLQ